MAAHNGVLLSRLRHDSEKWFSASEKCTHRDRALPTAVDLASQRRTSGDHAQTRAGHCAVVLMTTASLL